MRRPLTALLAGVVLAAPGLGWAASLSVTSADLTGALLASPTLYASALSSTDDRGGGRGKVDEGDSTTLVFGGALRPSSVCSSWTATTGAQTATGVTVQLVDGGGPGGNDLLTVSTGATPDCAGGLRLGAVDTGSPGFVTAASVSFTESTASLTWSATSSTVILVFGRRSGPLANPGLATVLTWTPDASTLDSNGLPIASGTASSASAVQW